MTNPPTSASPARSRHGDHLAGAPPPEHSGPRSASDLSGDRDHSPDIPSITGALPPAHDAVPSADLERRGLDAVPGGLPGLATLEARRRRRARTAPPATAPSPGASTSTPRQLDGRIVTTRYPSTATTISVPAGLSLHRIERGRGPLPLPLTRPATRHVPVTARTSAVLFDSGGVLIQPIGGRWDPRSASARRAVALSLGGSSRRGSGMRLVRCRRAPGDRLAKCECTLQTC